MSFLGNFTALLVSYNSRQVLPQSLAPFYGKMSIVVADNASSDGTVDFLRSEFPDITVVVNDQNLGYGSGFNSALKVVNTPFIIALSPDSEFSVEKLEELCKFSERYPNAAMVCPSLDVPRGGLEIWVMGPWELNHSRARFDADGPYSTWFSSGAVTIYRTDILKAIDGFDERIFLYNEDLDICIRLRAAGYSIVNVPHIIATHLNSGSAPPSVNLHWRKDWNFAWSHLYVTRKFRGTSAMLEEAAKILARCLPKSLFYAIVLDRKRFVRDFAAVVGTVAFLLGKSPLPRS